MSKKSPRRNLPESRSDKRAIQRRNQDIRRRNRRRVIFFAILVIFAIIGLVTVIGKLPFFNRDSASQKQTETGSRLAVGGDAGQESEGEEEVKEDELREMMSGIKSKEGFTDKLQKVLVANQDTEVYSSTDDGSGLVGRLQEGDYVSFYGSEDGWYKLAAEDYTGYGKAEYFDEPDSDETFKVVDGILIVNKDYSLAQDYDPGLNQEATQSFNLMQADMERENMTIYIAADYRGYADQEELYQDTVASMGESYAKAHVEEPGHSEHQTGLAIDVTNDPSQEINEDFAASKEAEWIGANAHKYGFIIRYPRGKKSATSYDYKAWHLRYLGPDMAKKIYDSGLTLEEYYDL